MTQVLENIAALNKKQMEIAVQAFQIGLNAWESLIKLNLEAAKSLLHEGAGSTEGLGSVQDVAGISGWTGGQFRAGAEKLSGYSRNFYEIGGQASSAWGDLLERTLLSTNQDVVGWIDEMLKSSPILPQPEAAAAAAKAAIRGCHCTGGRSGDGGGRQEHRKVTDCKAPPPLSKGFPLVKVQPRW